MKIPGGNWWSVSKPVSPNFGCFIKRFCPEKQHTDVIVKESQEVVAR